MKTSVQEEVFEILDKAQQESKPTPSTRLIRTLIGRGSMSTISKAVQEWNAKRIAQCTTLPAQMPDEAVKIISDAAWKAFSMLMHEQINVMQERAKEQIEFEKREADQLRQTAEEMLAEAANKENAMRESQQSEIKSSESIANLSGALEEARATNAELRNSVEQMRQALDVALKDAAASKAALASLKKMLPFLDKERLPELSNTESSETTV